MKKNEIMNTKGNNLLNDAQKIIETSQKYAFRAVNVALIRRNWLLGKRIAEEELQGKGRAEYGAEIIKELSLELTRIYGNGFDFSSLYKYLDFYKAFPNIFHTVSGKSNNSIIDTESLNSDDNKMSLTIENKDVIILDTVCPKSETTILDTGSPNSDDNKMSLTIDISEDTILDTVCPKSFSLLTWSHYRTLLQVKDPDARDWYMKEAADQTWSVRTLQRNISSQYYFRLLKSQKKDLVKKEMLEKTAEFQKDKFEIIKEKRLIYFQKQEIKYYE